MHGSSELSPAAVLAAGARPVRPPVLAITVLGKQTWHPRHQGGSMTATPDEPCEVRVESAEVEPAAVAASPWGPAGGVAPSSAPPGPDRTTDPPTLPRGRSGLPPILFFPPAPTDVERHAAPGVALVEALLPYRRGVVAAALPGASAAVAGQGLDADRLGRDLVSEVPSASPQDRELLIGAVAMLPPEEIGRLVASKLSGPADTAGGAPTLASAVIAALTTAAEATQAAVVAEVVLRDCVAPFGPGDERVVEAVSTLAEVHRGLDEAALVDLEERRVELLRACDSALGRTHALTLTAAGNLDRLRAARARRAMFGGDAR